MFAALVFHTVLCCMFVKCRQNCCNLGFSCSFSLVLLGRM
uniref:Uncharacterized protein n=1 Tax=Arundo donax TaxID=35708 RepID=A0A0A8Y846_ARUDO